MFVTPLVVKFAFTSAGKINSAELLLLSCSANGQPPQVRGGNDLKVLKVAFHEGHEPSVPKGSAPTSGVTGAAAPARCAPQPDVLLSQMCLLSALLLADSHPKNVPFFHLWGLTHTAALSGD